MPNFKKVGHSAFIAIFERMDGTFLSVLSLRWIGNIKQTIFLTDVNRSTFKTIG